jgi:hypothetical protein
LQTMLAGHGSHRVSVSTICRALIQLQLPRKKKSPRPGAGRKAAPEVSAAGAGL